MKWIHTGKSKTSALQQPYRAKYNYHDYVNMLLSYITDTIQVLVSIQSPKSDKVSVGLGTGRPNHWYQGNFWELKQITHFELCKHLPATINSD